MSACFFSPQRESEQCPTLHVPSCSTPCAVFIFPAHSGQLVHGKAERPRGRATTPVGSRATAAVVPVAVRFFFSRR